MEPMILIQKKNGKEFDMASVVSNLKYLGGYSSPDVKNEYNTMGSMDGGIHISTKINTLLFRTNFVLLSKNYTDLHSARHAIYKELFGNRDLVRIRTNDDFQKIMYARPKSFEINPATIGSNESIFSIDFEIPSGYKQSLKRSDTIGIDDISFNMNFKTSERPIYINRNYHFKIYNASDIAIDPYFGKHDIIIMFQFEGDYYKLVNNTNGSEYEYNNPSTSNVNIVLNGLYTSIEGKPKSMNTNFGYIKLEPGWNDFSVMGADIHQTTFSFPFLYVD